jgi:hypothetical protein
MKVNESEYSDNEEFVKMWKEWKWTKILTPRWRGRFVCLQCIYFGFKYISKVWVSRVHYLICKIAWIHDEKRKTWRQGLVFKSQMVFKTRQLWIGWKCEYSTQIAAKNNAKVSPLIQANIPNDIRHQLPAMFHPLVAVGGRYRGEYWLSHLLNCF